MTSLSLLLAPFPFLFSPVSLLKCAALIVSALASGALAAELLEAAPRHAVSVAGLVAMKDKRGKRAIDYARLRGHERVVKLLEASALT